MSQNDCVEALKGIGRPATAREIAAIARNSLENTRYYMHRLVDHGLVSRVDDSTPYRYVLVKAENVKELNAV